jgi:hypothetical protein
MSTLTKGDVAIKPKTDIKSKRFMFTIMYLKLKKGITRYHEMEACAFAAMMGKGSQQTVTGDVFERKWAT